MLNRSDISEEKVPTLSVVSPVRNEYSRIGHSLDSLLGQNFRDLEHIVADGSSDDGTLRLIERYAGHAPWPVKLMKNVGGGVYEALNETIGKAKGRYVAILHGSDAFASAAVLEEAMRLLESSGADMLYGDLHYVDAKGKTVRHYKASRFKPELLIDGFMPPHPTVIVRRSLFEEIGLYNTGFRFAADFDWLVRAFLVHKVSSVYLPLNMVEMTVGGLSGKWSARLWGHNRDKFISLRDNGLRINPLRLLKRYHYL